MGKLYVVHNKWIKDPETGVMPYKIGITRKGVKDRFYGTGLKIPGKFECDLVYEFEDEKFYVKLEKTIHGILNLQRVKGEWFYCNDTILYNIATICEDLNGKLVTEEIGKEISYEAELEDGDDSIFLNAQEKIEIILSTLTEKYKLQLYRKENGKLNGFPIENKFGARLECNIWHPYGKRIDLEFICRNTTKFPNIKIFIKELEGSNINGHKFKTSKSNNKIYHSFDYEDSAILYTFLELRNFVSEKMKNSPIFKEQEGE